MNVEIERKFLVREQPANLNRFPHQSIVQGYIFTNEHFELRLRKKADKRLLTIKKGAGLKRTEVETSLSSEQFDRLWPLTEGKRLQKVRYEIPHNGACIELDVYSGILEGLILAEVEFASEQESISFEPPSWFGKEVTEDERFKNKNLVFSGEFAPLMK